MFSLGCGERDKNFNPQNTGNDFDVFDHAARDRSQFLLVHHIVSAPTYMQKY